MIGRAQHAVPGAMHMHTTCSDGNGTVPNVIRAARQAGLRWIIITDHDTLEGRSFEGWQHDVFVIVGHEITPQCNHFLVLDVDYVVDREQPPQDFIDEVYAQGGFGIIAHPDDYRPPDQHRWEDWSVDGPRKRNGEIMGLELWNLMSDWRSLKTARNRYIWHLFPNRVLRGPTPATLEWWDRLNAAGKRTFGIGGLDAHAFPKKMPWGTIKLFPYRWMFRTLTNYVLLDAPLDKDATTARRQVLTALQHGHSYFINRMDGTTSGITFVATRDQHTWHMGDTVSLQDGPVTLHADVSRNAGVRLIHNGQVRAKGVRKLQYQLEQPGVYRLEGFHGKRPWLYTNPIYVFG